MYLEDEKDFIVDSEGEVHFDDENVSIEDIGIMDSDEIVEIKKSPKTTPKDDDIVSISNENTIDLGDDIELVQTDEEEEVSEDELREILTDNQASSRQKAFNSFGTNDAVQNDAEDFDIDLQIESANLDENYQDNSKQTKEHVSRKQKMGEKPAKSNTLPLLIILLAVVVGGGLYYYFTYFAEDNFATVDPQPKPTVQSEMDNLSQEDIANRAQEQIDVVQEDDAKNIKPDEKEQQEEEQKQEEKKNVITIIPTGRINPFLPTSKYIAVEKPVEVISYDKVAIPKAPKEYGKINEERDKMITIAVSGIMYDTQKPSAIITFDGNDYFVVKGDRLDNYRVVDITKDSVIVAYGKDMYRASVGEEFKVTNKFEGNAQFLNTGRQYYSVNSLSNGQNNKTEVPNYISENEINIIAK